MKCPQTQTLSQCVSVNTVPSSYGDTWGQFEAKPLLFRGMSKQSLNSRARVGTGRTKVSPFVPAFMGTGLVCGREPSELRD
jgi:hypothetical protein